MDRSILQVSFSDMSGKNDTSTYLDRMKMFLNITDPTTLFYSDSYILTAKQILRQPCDPDNEKQRAAMNKSVLELRSIVDSAIHPASGELIPRPFRMSAIAPVNIPIVFAMLACPPSNVAGTLLLHVLNQSYNSACNYANRSGSKQSNAQLLTAYLLAVTSACSFAFGLGKVMSRGPPFIRNATVIIPCLATSFANVSNICFTRADEIVNGTPVFDQDGNVCKYIDQTLYVALFDCHSDTRIIESGRYRRGV